MNRQLTEITTLDADLWLPWLDLYETAFLPAERMLVSFYLRLLREKQERLQPDHHLLAVQCEESFVGLAHYVTVEEQRLSGCGCSP